MKIVVLVPKNSNTINELEEAVENSLEISLSDFKCVWEGDINGKLDIDKHIPTKFRELVGTVVETEQDYFFSTSTSWLHVLAVDE